MPLKIGTKLTHIGPKFWICITFDLLMRFWWDRSMLEVWYWSPWPRAGTPSMCTQTAQTRKFKKFPRKKNFLQNFRKIKRAQMCHMVACMRSSVWDVKGTLLENLLMQKFFWNFENFVFFHNIRNVRLWKLYWKNTHVTHFGPNLNDL